MIQATKYSVRYNFNRPELFEYIKQKTGEQACPFNYLYWDFIARHKSQLSSNQRLAMIYNTWQKMPDKKKDAILDSAQQFLNSDELI